VFAGEGPSILSPTDNMTYYLVDRAQTLALQAGSGIDVREHRWYLDDAYLGSRRPGEKLFVPLSAGTHTVACMDDHGRLTRVSIVVQSAMN
jgi:membrane carboxypeptidase/penicillin-binding protein PbpC